jgi:hypothetical protein
MNRAPDPRGLDMVREFMRLEKVADALIPAGSGCKAAGQQLAGSQVELRRQAVGTDFHRQAHGVVLTYGSTSNIRDARKPLRDNRHG